MTLARREFLTVSGLVLLLASCRAAWERAGARPDFELALKQARDAGKPLLVFVVPEHRAQWREAGRDLGGWIDAERTHGTLSPKFALYEVICARMSEVDPAWKPTRHSRLVRIETDGESIAPEEWRLERLTNFAPVDEDVARRASQCRAALTEDERRRAEAWLADPASAAPEDLDRIAALAYERALELDETEREKLLAHLSKAAEQRLFSPAPEGSYWVDEDPDYEQGDSCPPCGMAWTPPHGRRFLGFYAE